MLVGGSSGMAAFAAVQLAHELERGPDDAVIVVLLPGLAAAATSPRSSTTSG